MNIQKYVQSQFEYDKQECGLCLRQLNHNQQLAHRLSNQPNPFSKCQPAQIIDKLSNCYHNASLIHLEDQMVYFQAQEMLKRSYAIKQYPAKIQMLSQYYKFHTEAPRLFMDSISQTISNFIDEKRQLEYQKVTNLLKQQHEPRQKKNRPHQTVNKLLDSIELSYEDFQKKQKGYQKKHLKNNKSKKKISNLPKKVQYQYQSIEKTFQKKYSVHNQKQKPKPNSKMKQSTKGLQRQKSTWNLEYINKQNPFETKSRHDIKSKPKNISTAKQLRNRCNSKGTLKNIPLKCIELNNKKNFINSNDDKNSIQNISKIEKKQEQHTKSIRKNSTLNTDRHYNSTKQQNSCKRLEIFANIKNRHPRA